MPIQQDDPDSAPPLSGSSDAVFVVAGLLPTKELELDDQPEQQQVVEEEMVVDDHIQYLPS